MREEAQPDQRAPVSRINFDQRRKKQENNTHNQTSTVNSLRKTRAYTTDWLMQ